MCNNNDKHKNFISKSEKETIIKSSTFHNDANKNTSNVEPTDKNNFDDEFDSATFTSIMQLLW